MLFSRSIKVTVALLACAVAWLGLRPGAAGGHTWDNESGDGLWQTASNWVENTLPTQSTSVLFPAGLAGTVTIASGFGEAAALTFQNSYTLSGPGDVVLAGVGWVIVDFGVSATIACAIAGNDGIAKDGSGTLVLDGPETNYFTGNVHIEGGVLDVDSTGRFGSVTNPVILFAGTLRTRATFGTSNPFKLHFASTIDVVSGTTLSLFGSVGDAATTTGDYILRKNGAGTLSLNAANTYTGGTIINAGAVSINADNRLGAALTTVTMNGGALQTTATFTTPRPVTLNPGGGTFNVVGGTTLAASGVISGGGALNKIGDGTLLLSGANTYSGGTVVTGGTVSIDDDNRLGTPSFSILLNGGTLANTASFTMPRPIVVQASGGGTINVATGTILTHSGSISGSGALTKTGAGTLTLSGSSANTHTGLTTVNEGTLRLSKTAGNAIANNLSIGDGSGTDIVILDASEQIANANVNVFTGEFNLNGFNETIGSMTMSVGQVTGGGGGGNAHVQQRRDQHLQRTQLHQRQHQLQRRQSRLEHCQHP